MTHSPEFQKLIEAAKIVAMVYKRDDEPESCKCSLCELQRAVERVEQSS